VRAVRVCGVLWCMWFCHACPGGLACSRRAALLPIACMHSNVCASLPVLLSLPHAAVCGPGGR
jgi:hypothetical protein